MRPEASRTDLCSRAAQHPWRVADYLAGRLSSEEEEDFERHCFECPACLEELEQAIALRAVFRRAQEAEAPTGAPAPGRQRRRPWLLPVAAILALALTLLWVQAPWKVERQSGSPATSTPPVYRGGERGLAVEIHSVHRQVTIRWARVKGAASYRVRIFDAQGRRLLERKTSAHEEQLSLSELRRHGQLGPLYARVVAFGGLEQQLAASRLVSVPPRGEKP